MREIKFRAWDKINGGWIEGMSSTNLLNPAVGKNAFFELMQYTGLKDKNGVEIYEGDILRNLEYDSNELGVVKYEYTEFLAMGGGDDHCWNILNHSSEVIGNIYENPELLP